MLARLYSSVLCILPVFGCMATYAATTPDNGNPAAVRNSAESQRQVIKNYGNLPLSFEVNQGQADSRVKFLSRGSGYSLLLTGDGAVLALGEVGACNSSPREDGPQHRRAAKAKSCTNKSSAQQPVRMTLAGAGRKSDAAKISISGEDQLPGKVNYFLGNDPARWRTDVPTYAKVRYSDIYPGIDLVYYGNQRQLEYDFVVAPGADTSRIQLQFSEVNGIQLQIGADGDLVLKGSTGEAVFHKPVIYQEKNGQRQTIRGHFRISANKTVGFALGSYDRGRPLVIDPVLTYSTYFGGSGMTVQPGIPGYGDQGNGIAVDASGNAYVVGTTYSTNFPLTSVAFQSQNSAVAANNVSTVFVTKLNATGTALIYSTYLGGSGSASGGDFGYGIALDSADNVYITGATYSTDFPVTCGAYKTSNPSTTTGAPTAFVSKLSPASNSLTYSTYLGGRGNESTPAHGDVSQAIAVDGSGNAYLTGYTYSSTFPVTSGAFQTEDGGSATSSNAFVTKLNPGGTALVYSTFLGGNGVTPRGLLSSGEYGNGITIDASGDTYVTGSTTSANFPVTSGAFQTTYGGYYNYYATAFVTELNPKGTDEVYSTYLGGSGGDSAQGIVVDSGGFAYVAGDTASSDFPVTAGVLEGAAFPESAEFTNGSSGFVTKLSPGGSALEYSTYLEGLDTSVTGLAVDGTGTAYVTGSVFAGSAGLLEGFELTADALPLPTSTANSAFLVKLDPSAAVLNYATLLGGNSNDGATALALDSAGNAYVTGFASSTNFPTTSGVFQVANNAAAVEGSNAFASKFALAPEVNQTTYPVPAPGSIPTTLSIISQQFNCPISGTGFEVIVYLMVNSTSNGPPPTGQVSFNGSFVVGENAVVSGSWGGTATVQLIGESSDQVAQSATWEAAYFGDSTYMESSLSGEVNGPGNCNSNPFPSLIPTPESLSHVAQSNSTASTVQGKGLAETALSSTSADSNQTSSTRAMFSVPGPKFTPPPAMQRTDGQPPTAIPLAASAGTAACIVPSQPAFAETPTFLPLAGTFTSAQKVTIADATSGATIYYTTNGTKPTSTSAMYSGAIVVSTTETVEAIAVATGYTNSAIASATYTINLPPPAALNTPSPAPNPDLGTSETFTWTAGSGVTQYDFHLGTTGVGSTNLYDSGNTKALTSPAVAIPSNGYTVYARLYSYYPSSNLWQYTDYTFTESGAPVLSVLNTPSPAPSPDLGTSETFTWTAGSGATQYDFHLGTTGVGSTNLYDSSNTTALTSPAVTIPSNGYTVYARLYSYFPITNTWAYNDYTFTESGAPVASVLNTPSPAPSPNLGTSETFTWTAGSGPSMYDFHVGTTGPGSTNLYDSGPTTALTSPAVAIPSSGHTVYVRISSYFPISNVWTNTDYTFTEP